MLRPAVLPPGTAAAAWFLACALAAAPARADPPHPSPPHPMPTRPSPLWNGTWTENVARSHLFFPQDLAVAEIAPGRYVATRGATTLRFDCGGDDRDAPVSCRRPDPDTFRLTWRRHGAVVDHATWTLSAGASRLAATAWSLAPDGSRDTATDTYRRVRGTGLAGLWRKTASTETPTTYVLSIDGDALHVVADAGGLDFTAPLVGALAPRPASVRARPSGDGNLYRVVAPLHLLETTYEGGVARAHGDLVLAPDGAAFTERHVDRAGHVTTVFFARGPARGAR